MTLKMDFWTLYDQYYERIKKFIRTIVKDEWTAEDLAQETFIKIQKNMASLKETDKLKSWIFRIAYNKCQDHFRTRSHVAENDQGAGKGIEILNNPMFQQQLEHHQMNACIRDKVTHLPETLKIVLILYDLMEFSHHEIAEVLELSVENTKVRLHRARKKLKEILEVECRLEHDERNVLVCEPVLKTERN